MTHLDNSAQTHPPKGQAWEQGLLLNDEWANYATHGLAFLLSLAGLFFLLKMPWQTGDQEKLFILGTYALSCLLMYMTSTLYHYLKNPLLKKKFRVFDHCAIYVFIAGSYTPFTLLLMKEEGGLTLFSVIWAMTLLGIVFKTFFIHRFQILSVLVYVAMGWLVIFSIDTLFRLLPTSGFYLLFAGGIFYTVGITFYALDHRRFFHAIWHLFTLSGSVCHYFCIYLYL